jgi:hypothetical protein
MPTIPQEMWIYGGAAIAVVLLMKVVQWLLDPAPPRQDRSSFDPCRERQDS